ncbi:O-methyltransferase [Curtobacterium sp. L3-7]|uniref:O-methyltransferase n=1 Tax=Curtobacterium sp. L3-7 TaxID=3138787 RepID=UPI003B51A39A
MTDHFPSGYARATLGPREPDLDAIVRRSLIDDRLPDIQVDDNAGRLLQLLTALQRPVRALEIGTLFGFSAVHIARGLPTGGTLTTLEVDADVADVARRNIESAGAADTVEVVVDDALRYLSLPDVGVFDLVFIDGEKAAYPRYLAAVYPLLADGALLIADDAFADGDFAAESPSDDGRAARDGITTYVRAVGRAPGLFSAFAGTETGFLVSRKVGA